MKFRNRWSTTEQAQFLEKLGKLLEKGYTLSNAIELLQFQYSAFRKVQLSKSIELLRQGNSLHDALLNFDFSKEVLSYLFFAEKHGDLSFSLLQGSQMLSKKQKFKDRLYKVLRYPLFLIGFVLILLIFLQQVLLPQFTSLYASMDVKNSVLMIILSELPQVLPIILLSFSILTILITLIYTRFIRKHYSMSTQMKFLLKIPFLKQILVMKNTQYFCSQLSCLLGGGLSILDSLSVFEEQRHMRLFQEESRKMREQLATGEHFDQILSKRPFYEKDMQMVIIHGQSNGTLSIELADYSELLMERIEEYLHRFTTILQPLIFLVVGGFVVTLYLSIMLPLFKMMEVL